MNRFKYFFATTAVSVLMSLQALAATAQISFSDPSVTVGSEVNVTMKVSSTDGTLSRADITLGYDSSLLEFISGTDAEGGAGTVRVKGATNGADTGTLEYNLKFKTLSAGTASVKISNFEVYDSDEAIAEVTHQGSSAVTISSAPTASSDAKLSSLVVSPGTLTPEFASEITEYSVIVGTDVNTLAINAVTSDSGATTTVSGNEGLNMGENNVSIVVTAADKATQALYTIKVNKQEGGPNADSADAQSTTNETVNEGVKLSSKEKTITIMSPGSDVVIPDGFAESTIDIDGHQVKGWVWKQESDHQYCIVYGMNDAGELNFYRYDLQEKTIQRYFEDPVEAELQKNAAKYPEVVERYDKLVGQYNSMFVLACVLGGIVLVLLIFIIVLLTQRRNSTHIGTFKRGTDDLQRSSASKDIPSENLDETIAISEINRKKSSLDEYESSDSDSDLEMTRIISKSEQSDFSTHSSDVRKLASDAGLDFEDLDDISDSDDDLGATKAFDFSKEWQTASSETKKIDIPSTKSDSAASDDGLDIEDL